MTSVTAIIPARGGSKGVIGKNLRKVGGETLLERAIQTARDVAQINVVVVSTDSDEIARLALNTGAEVVRRPESLSGDRASSESAVLHVCDSLYSLPDSLPDILVMMQCTSPFTRSEDIASGVEMVATGRADVAFAVAPWHGFLWRRNASGFEPVNHPSDHRPMRQELEPTFMETGAFYVMRANGFVNTQYRFFGHVEGVEVEACYSMDIDTEYDLALADTWAGRR